MIHVPNIWYFPSNYGDIRLERAGDRQTKLIYFKLTPAELAAMKELRKTSVGRRKWATDEDWKNIQPRDFQTGEAEERVITLNGSITAVGGFLRKRLRPDRETVTAIRIGDGKIEELRDRAYDVGEEEERAPDATIAADAADPDGEPANEEDTALAKTGTDAVAKADAPAKAATVKKPVVGCPAPTFDQIKLRATRVLRAFLTPQQVVDFERHQRFVTTGADTGHRYMLTSRNAPDQLRHFGARCVFDLDENRSYCVHDWHVPAEEELLTLHVLLSLPGHETWARGRPDLSPAGAGSGDIDALLAGV